MGGGKTWASEKRREKKSRHKSGATDGLGEAPDGRRVEGGPLMEDGEEMKEGRGTREIQ